MGAECDPNVERAFDVKRSRFSHGVHGFPVQADEESEHVAVFLNTEALGETAPGLALYTAILLDVGPFFGPLRKVDKARPVESGHDLL